MTEESTVWIDGVKDASTGGPRSVGALGSWLLVFFLVSGQGHPPSELSPVNQLTACSQAS